MPISANVFDAVMKKMIELCDPKTVVDIGPGMGKYGNLLIEIEKQTKRSIRKTCVEIDKEKVIKRFGLARIYDEIIHEDAARLVKLHPALTGDLVIAGDVIEHMTKSEGVDLIEYLQYRFKHIFLVIPVDWICFKFQDHEHESHISIWRPEDMGRFNGAYCIQRYIESGNRFLLCVVNGIMLHERDHFVVRDSYLSNHALAPDDGISFGYLKR